MNTAMSIAAPSSDLKCVPVGVEAAWGLDELDLYDEGRNETNRAHSHVAVPTWLDEVDEGVRELRGVLSTIDLDLVHGRCCRRMVFVSDSPWIRHAP